MKHHLRQGMPQLPKNMAKLPIDDRGYPVPWFVAWIDGKPDFRVLRDRAMETALSKKTCWLCGKPLNGALAFVIGPMCALTRTTSEPPCHATCASFACKVCPFLIIPSAKRREANLPTIAPEPGIAIKRNPGVALIWLTKSYTTFFDHKGSRLISVGEAIEVHWYAEGRKATREEVETSVNSGLPILAEFAKHDGLAGLVELNRSYEVAKALFPKAVAA